MKVVHVSTSARKYYCR